MVILCVPASRMPTARMCRPLSLPALDESAVEEIRDGQRLLLDLYRYGRVADRVAVTVKRTKPAPFFTFEVHLHAAQVCIRRD